MAGIFGVQVEPQPGVSPSGGFGRVMSHLGRANTALREAGAGRSVAEHAVGSLQAIGSQRAQRLAQLVQTNPQAAGMIVRDAGGWGNLLAQLRSEQAASESAAQSQRANDAAALALRHGGRPDLASLAAISPEMASNVAKMLEGDEPSPAWKKVKDPSSATGWSWQNVNATGGPHAAAGPSGISLETDAEGGLSFRQGAGIDFGAEANNDLETAIVSGYNQLGRLDQMIEEYDESALQYGPLVKDWLRTKAWKTGYLDISDETAEQMSDRQIFRAVTLENLNKYIHEMTGAQANSEEIKRMVVTQPNFEMAGPVFKKFLGAKRRLIMDTMRRTEYLYRTGQIQDGHDFNADTPMSVERFQEIRNRRGDQLAEIFSEQHPDASREEIQQLVLAELEKELKSGTRW